VPRSAQTNTLNGKDNYGFLAWPVVGVDRGARSGKK